MNSAKQPEPRKDKTKDYDAVAALEWLMADVTWFRKSLPSFLQMMLTSSKFSLKGVPSKSEIENQKIHKRQRNYKSIQSSMTNSVEKQQQAVQSHVVSANQQSRGLDWIIEQQTQSLSWKKRVWFSFKPRASAINHQKWHSLVSSHLESNCIHTAGATCQINHQIIHRQAIFEALSG